MMRRPPRSTLFPSTTLSRPPTITSGALQTGDTTTAFSQTFDTRNAGTGKTLTATGVVNDGNSGNRSEEHTSALQTRQHLVCRLLVAKETHSQNDNGSNSSAG